MLLSFTTIRYAKRSWDVDRLRSFLVEIGANYI